MMADDILEDQLFDAAKKGDAATLAALLDAHPDKLHARGKPYSASLLHAAADSLPCVDLLLKRGLDVNDREKGDNTYAMHWAAAAGNLEVVRRLADAGGDVIGHGDDHALEVIGWATCWNQFEAPGSPRAATATATAEFLVSRGARHHIYSAMSMRLADQVRRLVAADPLTLTRRMSRNEGNQTPLHWAVGKNLPDMVALLVELGADPLAVDAGGQPASFYATNPSTDRALMEKIRELTASELQSATRGRRPPNLVTIDLLAVLALGEFDALEPLLRENRKLIAQDGPANGLLHLMAKRNDRAAITWLLDHGADPNARWAHWGAVVTPLHLAAFGGHVDATRILLAAGADPRIHDSMHDSDAIGWAAWFKKPDLVKVLEEYPLQ